MASPKETGWQSEKTFAECVQYMLDNEIATDVCFEVGPPEGAIVTIRAHKFMLISRSPVFEAMFSIKMAETKNDAEAKIRIIDIEAEVFKLLLRFIYCAPVSMNVESAQALLYASQKYILPSLTKLCSKYLQSIVNTINVCGILEFSLTFDVLDLKSRCLGFISEHSDTVLNGNEILAISRQSFEAILKMDRIMSDPLTVFHSCVKWAKHELQSQQSIEAPTDQQVRETMGSLLYEIRFPTVSITKFGNLVGESDVLTAEEKSAVYYYLLSKKGKDKLKFSTVSRHELLVNRADRSTKGLWPRSQCSSCGSIKKSSYEFSFRTDKSILLTGLGLYTGHNRSKYDVEIAIKKDDISLLEKNLTVLLEKNLTVPATDDLTIFKFSFDKSIAIAAGQHYRISALAYQAIGHFGYECQESITAGNVIFTISSASSNRCRCKKCNQVAFGNRSYGKLCSYCEGGQLMERCTDGLIQIPQLYFIQ